MAVGENKAVAIEPAGSSRCMAEVACPDGVRHRRAAHRGAGMARVCRLDGVNCEGADRGDCGLLESWVQR